MISPRGFLSTSLLLPGQPVDAVRGRSRPPGPAGCGRERTRAARGRRCARALHEGAAARADRARVQRAAFATGRADPVADPNDTRIRRVVSWWVL